MNKEQQIEEMASDMDYGSIKKDLYPDDAKEIAKALYLLGYRKVSDSEAELQDLNIAKDLRRQLADIEAENKRLSAKLGQILLSIDTVKEMNAMCDIDDHRKQAVKEFADELKELLHNDYIKPSGFTDERCVFECIDELLRKYQI